MSLVVRTLPDHLRGDDRGGRAFRVAMADLLASVMSETDWKKIAALHGLEKQIIQHPRFLRSLSWGDPDYEGHVQDLVDHLHEHDPDVLAELYWTPVVQRHVSDGHGGDVPALWDVVGNLSAVALAAAAKELHRKIDLNEHMARIQVALPGDTKLAVGETKDMLEATMRTILHRRGQSGFEALDFPKLTTRCMSELGLLPTMPPATIAERHLRKLATSARTMIETVNELRNLAGTGHGKVVGSAPPISVADAQLVAAQGVALCAWLLSSGTPKKT